MSTRVEKGGPKFKPILKAKSRPPPPLAYIDSHARPAEPVQSVISPQQEVVPSNEFLSENINDSLTTVHGNVPSQAKASRSKSSGTPIIISDPRTRPGAHPSPQTNSATPKFPAEVPSTGKALTVAYNQSNGNGDMQQGAAVPKRNTVSQKQPKQTLLDAEEQGNERPSRRATKSAVQGTIDGEADTVPRKRSRRKLVSEGQGPREPRSSSRQHAELSRGMNSDNESRSTDGNPARKRRRRKVGDEVEGSAESIDPTQIKMKSICDDLGSGRKSSRWESSQSLYGEARKRAREERARLISEAERQERETGRSSIKRPPSKSTSLGGPPSGDRGNDEGQREEFSYDESLKASHYAPQVRISANGEIVLDVDSLQVDRSADPDIVEEYGHIEENDHSRFTNSGSWSKRRLVRWGKEDTALFYNALRQFGQNFDLIARILPGKTYRMCKNKFKAEDKKNPALIDEALKNAVAVDLHTLSRMTGKDFTGPTPTITARPALILGDNDEATTQRSADDSAGTANVEDRDAPRVQTVVESAVVSEQSEQPTPQSTFATTRHSESPASADTLLRRSQDSTANEIQIVTLEDKDSPIGQPAIIGVPRRAIPVLPVRSLRKR